MTQIVKKEVEAIGNAARANSSSGGNQNSPPRSNSKSWKMPWWLFRLLKFIIEMSPALGREISLLLEDFMLSVVHLWGVFKKLLKWSMWATGAMLLCVVLSLSENVFKIEIPRYLIILPPVLSLAILILVIMFRRKETSKTQEDSDPQNGKESYWTKIKRAGANWWTNWWVKGRLFPILACFALIHLSIFKLWPKFWVSQAWGDWSRCGWFWGIQIAVGIVASVKPEDKAKPAKYKFSTVALFFLVVTFVIHLTGWSPEDNTINLTKGDGVAQAATSINRNVRSSATPPTEMFDEECKARAGTLNAEMREKIKADFSEQLMMTPIACRESGFNQTKPGTNEVLKGEVDPNDHGVFQISLTNHRAKIAELKLDVDKYEGQVAYVRYLLGTPQGIDHWFPEVSGRWYAPMTVTVPVTKKWSGFVQMPKLTKEARYLIKNNKPILAEIDGKEVVVIPNSDQQLGSFRNIRFKALEGNDDTIVTIPIKFWPVP